MDVADKIRSGARWLGMAKLVTQVYSWVVTVLVMRLLVPEDFGLMAMSAVFVSFVSLFSELGLRVKLVQMPEKDFSIDYARKVFGLVLVTNLALVLTLAAASPLIAAFFKQDRLVPIIVTMAVCIMIYSFGSIPDALIKRKLDFRSVAIIDTLRGVAASTAMLIFAEAGFGVWSLVLGTIAGDLVNTIGLMIASPFRAWPSFKFAGMRDTLQWGGLVMLQRLVWWAHSGIDGLLIGRFYPAHSLGIYGTASTFAYLPLDKVGQILQLLSFTGLARVNQDAKMFSHYLHRATKLVALVMFPAFFGIGAVAAEFAPVVLGDTWLGIAPIAAILALAAPARCISAVMTESLNSLGKPELHLRCIVISAALFAAGIVAGVPFGLTQIAWGVFAAAIAACLNNIRTVCAQTDIRMVDLLAQIMGPTLAGIAMLLVLALIRPLAPFAFPSLAGLLATIALGAVIYVGLIALFDRDGFRLGLSLIRSNNRPSP